MDKLQWIKELVLAEQQMEESGVVDFSAGFDPESVLAEETIEFMNDLKTAFVETAAAFNQLKGSAVGNIKIYGISKTKADFMLFRNGFKLIFSVKQPGIVAIRFNSIGTSFLPMAQQSAGADLQQHQGEDQVKAHWGAFGELKWAYNGNVINLDYLVRYYLSRFVRESAK